MTRTAEEAVETRAELIRHFRSPMGSRQLAQWGSIGRSQHPESYTGAPLEEEIPWLLEEADLFLVEPNAAIVMGEASRKIPPSPVPSGPSEDGTIRGDLPARVGYVHLPEPLDLTEFADPDDVAQLAKVDPPQVFDPQIKTLRGVLWSTHQMQRDGDVAQMLVIRPFYRPDDWMEMTGLPSASTKAFTQFFTGAPLMPGTPDVLTAAFEEGDAPKPGDERLVAGYENWDHISKFPLRWLLAFGAIAQSIGERKSVPRPSARRALRAAPGMTDPKGYVLVDLPGFAPGSNSGSGSTDAGDQQFAAPVIGHFRNVPVGPRLDNEGEAIDPSQRETRLTWIHPHIRRPDLPIRPRVHRVRPS